MSNSDQSPRPDLSCDPAPKFCSSCQTSFPGDSGQTTCPVCGDQLISKGYCPVCEAYLTLAVGAVCPKHDLALEAMQPPRYPFEALSKPGRWVTVCHFADTLAAEAPRIRLEAEGIPTFIDNERMGSRSMYTVATGGVRLKVPEPLAADARVVLSQTWSALAAELDIENDEDHGKDQSDPESDIEPHGDVMSLPWAIVFFWP